MSEKEEGKIIDKFLERFNSEKTILLMYLGDFNEPEILEIRDILVELNIIKNQENKYYLDNYVYLTKKGRIISEKGWDNYNNELNNDEEIYLNSKKENENLNKQIQELTLKSLLYEESNQKQKNRIRDLEEEFKIYETNQGKKIKNWSFIIIVINLIIVFASFLIPNRIDKPIENPKIDQLEKKQLRILKRLDFLKNPLKPKPILNQPKK
jgi:hypothetical protein